MMVHITIITAMPNMYDMLRVYMQSHNIKGERFTLKDTMPLVHFCYTGFLSTHAGNGSGALG